MAILGRNGAGKTTLLKTLSGDLKPTRGSIRFDNVDATRLRTEQRVRRGIGYVPQEHGVFAKLSVRDNLLVGAMATTDGEKGIDEIAERLAQLAEKIAIVIVEQRLKLALGVSQYCYVTDRGRIALRGESAKVRDDPELVRLLAP